MNEEMNIEPMPFELPAEAVAPEEDGTWEEDTIPKEATEEIPMNASAEERPSDEATSPEEEPLPDEVIESESESTPDGGDAVTVEALREELANLREELAQTRALHARMDSELTEFCNLFPEVSPTTLPNHIWEEVRLGIPLAASYALYEKKCAVAKALAEEINAQNAQKSSGAAGKDTAPEYFTPDDVRAMSRAEVHNNYQKIMNSMKKWNA